MVISLVSPRETMDRPGTGSIVTPVRTLRFVNASVMAIELRFATELFVAASVGADEDCLGLDMILGVVCDIWRTDDGR
jgi:hypothetical protein